ncbi:hypothetical protein BKA81DRAFT_436264 [Phyllosticta paracitricarpa]
MPLLLPSLSLPRLPLSFPLPLPHTSATKHCIQLVDLDQADAAYAFQREHSAWEESPAPPPNTPNKPKKAKKNVNMNNASQLDVALEFGGDFEREWGLRFGGVEEEGCRNESCETVIHDAPPGLDVEEMAEEIETEESEEEEDEFLLDTPDLKTAARSTSIKPPPPPPPPPLLTNHRASKLSVRVPPAATTKPKPQPRQ